VTDVGFHGLGQPQGVAGIDDDTVDRQSVEPEQLRQAGGGDRNAVASLVLDIDAAVTPAVPGEVHDLRVVIGERLANVFKPGGLRRFEPETIPEFAQLQLLMYLPHLLIGP